MAGLFNASRLYEALKEVGLLPTHSGIPSGYYDSDANRMTGLTNTTKAHERPNRQHNIQRPFI